MHTSSPKADFIRQHNDVAANDVVAMAKKRGMNVTTAYVYMVRNGRRATSGKANQKSTRIKFAKPEKVSVQERTQKQKYVRIAALLIAEYGVEGSVDFIRSVAELI